MTLSACVPGRCCHTRGTVPPRRPRFRRPSSLSRSSTRPGSSRDQRSEWLRRRGCRSRSLRARAASRLLHPRETVRVFIYSYLQRIFWIIILDHVISTVTFFGCGLYVVNYLALPLGPALGPAGAWGGWGWGGSSTVAVWLLRWGARDRDFWELCAGRRLHSTPCARFAFRISRPLSRHDLKTSPTYISTNTDF